MLGNASSTFKNKIFLPAQKLQQSIYIISSNCYNKLNQHNDHDSRGVALTFTIRNIENNATISFNN